jgi:hypothetical protein
MTVPDRVTSDWIATLGNAQLVAAESQLHAEFRKQDDAEKRRAGSRYALLQGPPVLVNAWLRWLLVSNETRTRGLVVRHAKK